MNIVELTRILHNLIRFGTIAEVDHGDPEADPPRPPRVRVLSGELLTDWLPWLEQRAGTTRTWSPPTVGEQAMLFSPGGDPAAGVVLVGVFSDAHPAPANAANLWRRVMPDGAVLEYDHAAHHLQASLPGTAKLDAQGGVTVTTAAKLTATAAGGATVNANTVINGNLTLNGNFSQPAGQTATMAGDVAFQGAVTSNGKDISSEHAHDKIEPGNGISGGVV